MIKQITGFFLSFDNDEIGKIYNSLEQYDYKKSNEGLKNFIIDSLIENDNEENENIGQGKSEKIVDSIKDYISQNPDTVLNFAGSLGNAIKAGLKKCKK